MSHPIPYDDFLNMLEEIQRNADFEDAVLSEVLRLGFGVISDYQSCWDDVEVDYLPSAFWLAVLRKAFVPKRIVDAVIRFYEPKTDDLEIARKIVDLAKTKR